VSRFIPVVRHLISIPAGLARMPIVPFCIYTFVGATMWNGLLLYLGFKFHENLDRIKHYSKPLDYAFIAVCLLGALAYYLLHRKSAAAKAKAAVILPGSTSEPDSETSNRTAIR
jgi:membrane protein DedA with SNARE-associated domain